MKIEVFGKNYLSPKLTESLELVLDRASQIYDSSENERAEIYIVRSYKDVLDDRILEKYDDGSYSIPLDLHPSFGGDNKSIFVLYSLEDRDVPKFVIIRDSLKKDKTLCENIHAALSHEIGHLYTWNDEKEFKTRKNIREVFSVKENNGILLSNLVEMISNVSADDCAIRSGFDYGLYGIRENHADYFLKGEVRDSDLSLATSVIGGLSLISCKSQDEEIVEQAKKKCSEFEKEVMNLSRDKELTESVHDFTKWFVESGVYQNIESILSYPRKIMTN